MGPLCQWAASEVAASWDSPILPLWQPLRVKWAGDEVLHTLLRVVVVFRVMTLRRSLEHHSCTWSPTLSASPKPAKPHPSKPHPCNMPHPKNLCELFSGENLQRLKQPAYRKITLKIAILPLFYSAFLKLIQITRKIKLKTFEVKNSPKRFLGQTKTEVALQFLECWAAEVALQHWLFCNVDVFLTKSCAAKNCSATLTFRHPRLGTLPRLGLADPVHPFLGRSDFFGWFLAQIGVFSGFSRVAMHSAETENLWKQFWPPPPPILAKNMLPKYMP